MAAKVAVVIGIQNTRGMTPLPGAAAGGRKFIEWLQQAGYSVHRFIDVDGDEVTRRAIFDTVSAVVEQRQTRSLVVYFAGHGVAQKHTQNLWFMPEGRPNDPTEAVNLELTLSHARSSGIPHVAVVADACRLAAGKAGLRVDGASIFPAEDSGTSKLDVYLSSQLGEASYEVIPEDDIEQAYGIFTAVLLAALDGSNREATEFDHNLAKDVVTAESLASHLRRVAPRKAAGIARLQVPYCPTESGHIWATFSPADTAEVTIEVAVQGPPEPTDVDLTLFRWVAGKGGFDVHAKAPPAPDTSALPLRQVYEIGAELDGYTQNPNQDETMFELKADTVREIAMRPPTAGALPGVPGPPPPSFTDSRIIDDEGRRLAYSPATGIWRVQSEDLLTGRLEVQPQHLEAGEAPRVVSGLFADPAAEAMAAELSDVEGRRHFETGTGLSVVGAEIIGAAVAPSYRNFFPEGSGWHVRGEDGTKGGSAVLSLEGGLFVGLGMYPDLVGTVTVRDERVVQVTYWPTYDYPPSEIRRDLALISMAALRGRFEIAIDVALQFGDRIRKFKHADPVLGVFAAYAFHRTGRHDKIREMAGYFRDRYQPVPFDLFLLSGLKLEEFRREFNAPFDVPLIIPSFPLLTQGWSLLTEDSTFHPAIQLASQTLRPSLFTMPDEAGGQALMLAIKYGELDDRVLADWGLAERKLEEGDLT